jgi:hypothetical protein
MRIGIMFFAVTTVALVPASGRADPVLPSFSTAVFLNGAPVNNVYFPLTDPKTRTFVAEDERFELTNIGSGPTILGVRTTVQRDRSFEEGRLVEDTFDYYAQDTAGNVWYMGEDVTNYIYDDNGNLIRTTNESAWRAGVNGALPGFIMPANPTEGFSYFQEFAPADDALDQARIFAVGQTVSVRVGTFTNVLQILETTTLELDSREFKFYAPGVGLILAHEGLSPALTNPEAIFQEQEQAPVPEPAAVLLVTSGVFGITARVRRRRRAA